ncbi:hypothetical protein A7M79_19180 [Acinetobacter baumannii]|nr:hypothetical protein A7M79_19180 [Acinetobacter baumannii]
MSEHKCIDCGNRIPMSAQQEREGNFPTVMICPSCREEANNMEFDDIRDALMEVGIPIIN